MVQIRGPYWWEYKLLIGSSRGSNPGINVLDLPLGVRPMSHSTRDFGGPGPSWGEYRSVGMGGGGVSYLGVYISLDLYPVG